MTTRIVASNRDDAASLRQRASIGGMLPDWPTMKAVMLTGTGKRYDIVRAFAQHTFVIACDPNPLAPAQYAATCASRVPLIKDPDYVPALQRAGRASTTSARSSR